MQKAVDVHLSVKEPIITVLQEKNIRTGIQKLSTHFEMGYEMTRDIVN